MDKKKLRISGATEKRCDVHKILQVIFFIIFGLVKAKFMVGIFVIRIRKYTINLKYSVTFIGRIISFGLWYEVSKKYFCGWSYFWKLNVNSR